jgi:predicted RNA-binding protein with PIN domain
LDWVIDGMNLVGSTPDGWWRDRPGAIARLVGRLCSRQWPSGDRVTVVFDGAPVPVGDEEETAGVEVRFAGRGRSSGDELIASLAAQHPDPGDLLVVTSDRGLAERVRATGATVASAGSLLRDLES